LEHCVLNASLHDSINPALHFAWQQTVEKLFVHPSTRPVLSSRPFPSTKLRTNGLRIEGLRANGGQEIIDYFPFVLSFVEAGGLFQRPGKT
jgi:hypothetical protein